MIKIIAYSTWDIKHYEKEDNKVKYKYTTFGKPKKLIKAAKI